MDHRWSAIAAYALSVTPATRRYDELAEQRLALLITEGDAAATDIAALGMEMSGLPEKYAAEAVSVAGQNAVLDALHEQVTAVVALEREAAAILAG